jgi:hypothetical protein
MPCSFKAFFDMILDSESRLLFYKVHCADYNTRRNNDRVDCDLQYHMLCAVSTLSVTVVYLLSTCWSLCTCVTGVAVMVSVSLILPLLPTYHFASSRSHVSVLMATMVSNIGGAFMTL